MSGATLPFTSPFNGLQLDRELACTFFAVFSRFEFALKEEQFVRINRHGQAEPHWELFKERASDQWIQTPETEDAVALLLAEPPQVQTGAQTWRQFDLRGQNRFARAIEAAKRVRNSLFHGGKHTPHSPPGRDEALVNAALLILYACLDANTTLRDTYNQHEF